MRAHKGKNVDRYMIFIVAVTFLLFGIYVAFMHYLKKSENKSRIVFSFDRYLCNFKAMGKPEGDLSLDKNPPNSSKGALKYVYDNEVDEYTGVGRLGVNLNNFKEIRIRMMSEKDRIFAVSVDEKDTSAVYLYVFHLKGGKWQDVVAKPSDFQLSAASSDPNGVLDLSNLNSRLVIADLSGDRGIVGPNTFWIEKIEVVK